VKGAEGRGTYETISPTEICHQRGGGGDGKTKGTGAWARMWTRLWLEVGRADRRGRIPGKKKSIGRKCVGTDHRSWCRGRIASREVTKTGERNKNKG